MRRANLAKAGNARLGYIGEPQRIIQMGLADERCRVLSARHNFERFWALVNRIDLVGVQDKVGNQWERQGKDP